MIVTWTSEEYDQDFLLFSPFPPSEDVLYSNATNLYFLFNLVFPVAKISLKNAQICLAAV
jgi:hypothetical protein